VYIISFFWLGVGFRVMVLVRVSVTVKVGVGLGLVLVLQQQKLNIVCYLSCITVFSWCFGTQGCSLNGKVL